MASQPLRTGVTWHCGCQPNTSQLTAGDRTRTHGMRNTRTYTIWCCMKARGKGKNGTYAPIEVCGRWQKFENFLADMGEAPDGMSIDRIDNGMGYQPGNCRWATRDTQNNNRTNNIVLTHAGVTATLSQWARMTGHAYSKLYKRYVTMGWDTNSTLSTP